MNLKKQREGLEDLEALEGKMPEYIDRKSVLDKSFNARVGDLFGEIIFTEEIKDIPAADVATVRHGKWKHTDLAYRWGAKDECSECGFHSKNRDDMTWSKYCPNCGALMDEEV